MSQGNPSPANGHIDVHDDNTVSFAAPTKATPASNDGDTAAMAPPLPTAWRRDAPDIRSRVEHDWRAYTRRLPDAPWSNAGTADPAPTKVKCVWKVTSGFDGSKEAALKVVTTYCGRRDDPMPDRDKERLYRAAHRESEIMDLLNGPDGQGHPNIVRILGHVTHAWHGDAANGTAWDGEDQILLMEWLPHTLAQDVAVMRGHWNMGWKTYDADLVRKVGLGICAALEWCEHALGTEDGARELVLHRDIKPGNLFLDERNGQWKLGDFGASRLLDPGREASTGIGTADFMAPEVLAGESYDVRADIYGLGLVLYLLCNDGFYPGRATPRRFPGLAKGAAAGFTVANYVPRPDSLLHPAHGPAALWRVIERACAYDPADRFPTVAEFRKALEKVPYETDDASDGGSNGLAGSSPKPVATPAPTPQPTRIMPREQPTKAQPTSERPTAVYGDGQRPEPTPGSVPEPPTVRYGDQPPAPAKRPRIPGMMRARLHTIRRSLTARGGRALAGLLGVAAVVAVVVALSFNVAHTSNNRADAAQTAATPASVTLTAWDRTPCRG